MDLLGKVGNIPPKDRIERKTGFLLSSVKAEGHVIGTRDRLCDDDVTWGFSKDFPQTSNL